LRTPEEPRALLKISREGARERLVARIQEGQKLVANPIQSGEHFTKAEQEHEKWRAYNRGLLSRQLFTTDEYTDEYRASFKLIHKARDRYDPPSLAALVARLNYSVGGNQIACLQSIIERLELIDKASVDRSAVTTPGDRSKVFVVHGHDEGAREAVARFIQGLGFQPIILHERASEGRTVIEKVKAHGDVGFAVVLLTPDDEGCAKGATTRPRARQNVILELGYFIGGPGRNRVCAETRRA
jgi:hypothetical protein